MTISFPLACLLQSQSEKSSRFSSLNQSRLYFNWICYCDGHSFIAFEASSVGRAKLVVVCPLNTSERRILLSEHSMKVVPYTFPSWSSLYSGSRSHSSVTCWFYYILLISCKKKNRDLGKGSCRVRPRLHSVLICRVTLLPDVMPNWKPSCRCGLSEGHSSTLSSTKD